ncbi:hypothetical protein CRM22_004373 [Opisthorchis felineus]|uniref:Uncharacterized protein n=1 Tax=Opisthorchis felineus TaxID=147828 RepID=A0A4S2M311_OPIFE|nr:hypothetical protein CRM22_004373 [Opisthorchis felineus]
MEMNSTFIVKISLCRTVVPVLLLSLCVLSIIDTFRNLTALFSNHYITVVPEGSSTEPMKPSEDQPADTKPQVQSIMVFFVEFFGIVISFLTGTFSLLSYCCGLLWSDDSAVPNRNFCIPFPQKQTMDRRKLMATYLEFACFLLSIAGTFGSLMLITTTALRYQGRTTDAADSLPGVACEPDFGLCRIIRIGEILNATLMFLCNLCLLTVITNVPALFQKKRISSSDIGNNFLLKQREQLSDGFATRICICLRLGRMLLSLSSVLISSGGLIILGRLLQLITFNSSHSNDFSFVHEVLSLTTGISCIGAGLFSVTAVQCCSVPLETFIDQYKDPHLIMNKPKFSHSLYVFALILTFLVIPSTISSYVSLHMPFFSKQTVTNQQPTQHRSQNLVNMSYTLLFFASVAAYLSAVALVAVLLVDLFARIKLMTLNSFTNIMNRCWTRSSSMPLEIISLQPRDMCDCSKLVEDQNTRDSNRSNHTGGQIQWNQLITSFCESGNNSVPLPDDQTELPTVLDNRRFSLAVENTVNRRFPGTLRETNQNGGIQSMIRSSCVPEISQNFESTNKSPHYKHEQQVTLSQPLESLNNGQLVYKCTNALFGHQPSEYQKLPMHSILPPYFRNQHKFEACEYMSCDLLHPVNQVELNGGRPCEPDNEKFSDKLVGYYYIDTTSEDFITSV